MTSNPRHGLTEHAADAAIDQACRMLRLPTIRAQFPGLADAAAREQMSYRAFIAELLMAECDDRARRRSERRIKAAGFPREKSLRTFDFDANPNIDPAVINTLATCDWVKKGLPLCLIGDSGTGKSHLLIALGTEAAMGGYRVRYTLAAKLVNELVEAADDRQLTKTINRYGRVDLVCIDELGYMELDRRGAELLFQVLTEREERPASPSPPTSRSAAGPRPSPTLVCAPPSSTGSPSAATSSRPARTPTASPARAPPSTPSPHHSHAPDLPRHHRRYRAR
jgi:DNA replication protein DnaC